MLTRVGPLCSGWRIVPPRLTGVLPTALVPRSAIARLGSAPVRFRAAWARSIACVSTNSTKPGVAAHGHPTRSQA